MPGVQGSTMVPPCNGSGPSGPDLVECGRCEWKGDSSDTKGLGHCPRCGCFVRRNEAAVQHGARRLASGRGTPLDRTRMVQIEADVTEDLGGSDAVSGVMSALVADFAFAVVLRDLLAAHLAATGPLTRAGKKKAAYTTWLQASARAEALARQIGTGRKAAKVPSLDEVLSGVASATETAELDDLDDASESPARPCPVPLPGIGHDHEGIPDAELHDGVAP